MWKRHLSNITALLNKRNKLPSVGLMVNTLKFANNRKAKSGLFLHVDCDVRAFGGELHCVCNGDDTPVSKALDKQDDKAYEMRMRRVFS